MMREVIKRAKNQKGFTLVELMVVVLIIGLLVAVAIPIYNNVTANARMQAHNANVRTLLGAGQMYIAGEGVPSGSTTWKKDNWNNTTTGIGGYLEDWPENPLGDTETNPANQNADYELTVSGTGDVSVNVKFVEKP